MKIASRYLLPLELFTAVLMLSWGFASWVGGGLLWKTLLNHGLNTEWGLALCGIGAAQLAVCSIEWFAGRRWDCSRLLASVTVRYWLAFASGVVWLYATYILVTLRGADVVFTLAIQAPAAVIFSAWIFVGNRKVGCLLDPAVSTKRLQGEILAEREDLLRGH